MKCATLQISVSGDQILLSGEMDLTTCQGLVNTINGVADNDVTIDLLDLRFIDASGLSAIISAQSNLEASGSRLIVRNAKGIIREVIEITGLSWLLSD